MNAYARKGLGIPSASLAVIIGIAALIWFCRSATWEVSTSYAEAELVASGGEHRYVRRLVAVQPGTVLRFIGNHPSDCVGLVAEFVSWDNLGMNYRTIGNEVKENRSLPYGVLGKAYAEIIKPGDRAYTELTSVPKDEVP